MAYRDPESDRTLTELQAKVTSSGGTFDIAALAGGDLSKTTLLPAAPVDQKAWVRIEFPRPQSVSGLTFIAGGGGGRGFGGRGGDNQALESSDDGQQFRNVPTDDNHRKVNRL